MSMSMPNDVVLEPESLGETDAELTSLTENGLSDASILEVISLDAEPVGGGLFEGTGFTSCCKMIDRELTALHTKYGKEMIVLSKKTVDDMKQTAHSLDQKEICISVFGHHNCGKSTFLNALIGDQFLPVYRKNETSVSVKIQHDSDIHKGICSQSCAQEVTCPKLIVVKQNGRTKHHRGRVTIKKKLEEYNRKARANNKKTPKSLILKVHIPLLAESVPSGWTVSLVDNPGFADSKEHVSQLAESSIVTSAAYIYLIETQQLEGKEDHDAFAFLAKQDPECFTDDRFVVAVAKFDENYKDQMEGDRYVDEKEATSSVCALIRSATDNKLDFQEDNVFPLSGDWALKSSMLASCPVDDPNHVSYKDKAVSSLKMYPRLSDMPSGEGQSDLSSHSPQEIVRCLDDASGISIVKKRIHFMVSKACVKIWCQKMLIEYNRYMSDAHINMEEGVESLQVTINGKEKMCAVFWDLHKAIVFRLENLEGIVDKSRQTETLAWIELTEAYPKDLEELGPKIDLKCEENRSLVEKKMKEFSQGCMRRICDGSDHFGPTQFEQELQGFLDEVSKTVEKSFDHFQFHQLNEVLLERVVSATQDCCTLSHDTAYLFETMDKFKLVSEIQSGDLSDTEYLKIEDQVSETKEQFKVSPNLRNIKDGVAIPSVSLTLWKRIKKWFSLKLGLPTSEETIYRIYTDIADTVDSVQEMLLAQCGTTYFDVIKPHVVEYFHDQYARKIRGQLKAFHAQYGERLVRERSRLEKLHESLTADEQRTQEVKADIKTIKTMQKQLMEHYKEEFNTISLE